MTPAVVGCSHVDERFVEEFPVSVRDVAMLFFQ